MADESSHVVRGINWRETFPFTQIFRAFRVAIHPTKLILALVALLALYTGGRLLDSMWPVRSRALPAGGLTATPRDLTRLDDVMRLAPGGRLNEVAMYERYRHARQAGSFDEEITNRRKELEEEYVAVVRDDVKVTADAEQARRDAASGGKMSEIQHQITRVRDESVVQANKTRDESLKAAKNDDDRQKAEGAYKQSVRTAYEKASRDYRAVQNIKGQGIFAQFFDYEVHQVNNIVWAVLANDWLGGFGGNPYYREARPGVLQAISNFFVTGPWWLVRYHPWFFLLFATLFSIVWAIFGGAIARVAAVHVARDEKITLSGALRFSTGKFLSFIFAPIIPLLIVLVVGVVVALASLVGNIPGIGPILMGLFFFLALAAGFVMALVLLGTAGGFNLMYPTIAVEGSDSFDAISRSFSYVYARPWRMLFYTLLAVIYGALCFLFVRFFIQLMLALTHQAVGAGMMKDVAGNVPIDLWNTMWPPAAGPGLSYTPDTLNLGPAQSLGARLIEFWVHLTIGLLGAFAISFYFSANTIVYYLMRREVDATELDDVYLEQSEEDFGDTPPTTAPLAGTADAAAATTGTTVATAPATVPVTAPATTGGAQVFPAPGETPPASPSNP